MKIKFNNVGTVNEKIDSLSNIHLCSKNLRYSLTPSLDVDLFSFISSDETNKKENEIVMDILNNEGDLNNLCALFESMYVNGFDSNEGPIILVKPQNNDNTFIVAEGNRRITSLKLLAKDIEMPSLDQLYFYKNTTNEKSKNNCKKNYEKINNLITQINTKFTNFTIAYTIIDSKVNRSDPQKLRSFIFNKHMPGPRPGMRQWSRGQYFALLLKYFPEGFDNTEEFQDKVWSSLRRTPKSVFADFKSAQFVMHVIKAGEDTLSTNEEVYSKMRFDGEITALEPKFCLKHIRKSASQFLYIDKKHFEDDYFKYEFDNNGVIRFVQKEKKIPYTKMLKFIYTQYTNKILTTRPVRPEKINDFNLAVQHLLNSTEVENIKDVDTIDFFNYSISNLDKIKQQLGQKRKDKIISEIIDDTKNIKNNLKDLINLINKTLGKIGNIKWNEPKYVFKRLYEQCTYNAKPTTPFLHAIAATIRAILEQYFIWAAYYYKDFIVDYHKEYSNCCKQQKKEDYITHLVTGKYISRIFRYIKNEFFNEKKYEKANNFLTKILLSDKKAQNKEIVKSLVDNINDINDVFNECIHSSYKISTKYHEYLQKIEMWLKILTDIIGNIDHNKIEKISIQIKSFE